MHRIYTGICILCGLLLVAGLPAAAWTAEMDVTTGTVTFDLEYGVDLNSTAQFDSGVDEAVPPPIPGIIKYAAYFVLPDGVFKELSIDIRPEAGWQMYVFSDEDLSLAWSKPPVSLSLTPVGLSEGGEVYKQSLNMSAQQSLSLEPGRYYVTIAPATSGDEPTPTIIAYQPPAVVTATPTPQPTGTPVPQTPVSVVTQVGTPAAPPVAATEAPTAVPVATGNIEPGMTVSVPDNTTIPTQSPISAMVPLAGAGIFILFYRRKT